MVKLMRPEGLPPRLAHRTGWHGSRHGLAASGILRTRQWRPQAFCQTFRGRVCETPCPERMVAGGQPRHKQARKLGQSPPHFG